ncbi:putative D-cysteine desulfhydrase 2, mitochondrial [Iris pallida]|uniref:D-cysteine desulfhydrase 2, mitochondrial n=1 Tax=Iris pallida TaxID=29817 RepID=A0AAX6GBV1_IRIPA|nr:putative D-cysteine desulfhydrase 2, mitochondrial [Iris pallida]
MMRYHHAMGMSVFSPKLPLSSSSSSSIHSSSLLDVLNREWMLPSPSTHIHKVSLKKEPGSGFFSCSNDPNPNLLLLLHGRGGGGGEAGPGFFYVVRDDLLHPLVNGNKSRKLDALLPILQRHSATHTVSCGGCQSAHAAALAVSCAERGIKAHLLLRGEQPEIPTGYNLVSLMYGNVTYVPRSIYAQREQMLHKHAIEVAAGDGCVVRVDDILGSTSEARAEESSRKVVIVSEGAGDVVGLLGVVRLVRYLSQAHVFGKDQQINIVVDAGTGTTAIGLALGALYLGHASVESNCSNAC